GVSIKKLLADPNAKWTTPALTTHGFQNHAARSAEWRYIRYENGDEELYDETKDPYEWTNVAGDKKNDKVKAELAKVFPTVNKSRGANASGRKEGARAGRQQRRNNRAQPNPKPLQR
nr:iduronate-2-sulfatase [Pyrinomonadaceae bacterium]